MERWNTTKTKTICEQSPISPRNALSSRYRPLTHGPQMGRAVPGCLLSICLLNFQSRSIEVPSIYPVNLYKCEGRGTDFTFASSHIELW